MIIPTLSTRERGEKREKITMIQCYKKYIHVTIRFVENSHCQFRCWQFSHASQSQRKNHLVIIFKLTQYILKNENAESN